MFRHFCDPQTIYSISSNQNDSNFGIQLILAIFTGAAVLVALFQELIKNYINRAVLDMQIKLSPPDCHQIDLTNSITGQYIGKAIYIRIRVSHIKGRIAKNVEIIIANVLKLNNNGKWVRVKSFLPMNLQWSHGHQQTITVPPKSFRHCDLGSFRQGSIITNFLIDTLVQPNPVSNGIIPNLLNPGTYLFECVLSGENVKPQTKKWKISFNPNWSNVEKTMLRKNIKIKEHK